MHSITQYTDFFISYLENQIIDKEPKNLYDPISYILSLGGKRIRPVLTLLTTEIFGTDYKLALPAALAVEVFHNSSLVHDDIIDEDPIRRGKPTVHKKWNTNVAILAGDAMIILTYHYLQNYEPNLAKALTKAVNKMGIEVCEGQTWDVDFETRQDVTVSEYLKMIEYKTGALIATSMKMGAIIAQTSKENCDLIYDFGLNLGLAFQLQDDYLDLFGDTPTFGRRLCGDIISNKKTYLYFKALEILSENEKQQLMELYAVRLEDNVKKIETITGLFIKSGVPEITQESIKKYTFKASEILDKINIDEDKKVVLRAFAESLIGRRV
ncbi:polyprenyl synthetase family protein [Flavobacterium sp. WLB]|uniref:polyprenyl synthetase family protein n=1 Tax=unclassified Flavobacterium TaxID=196869 RepID=UPI0006ABE23A|nr:MULTISPECIES: polyprenyl synthetase family protein [unclassified Flavobacterium]KOP39668.1 polyprenyl synthetase [Flavobacterium sp. VMW]OWU90221.1 polyprenyl synthetase [Flavobacterium sp. NLM]PUU70636.1 polyprenyl synthetase family protein [Flavobacterium sp. WLB]